MGIIDDEARGIERLTPCLITLVNDQALLVLGVLRRVATAGGRRSLTAADRRALDAVRAAQPSPSTTKRPLWDSAHAADGRVPSWYHPIP
jgi:hypothetical protein